MRKRTCYASSVCCSDGFAELSPEAQALYFQLGFYADSDGALDGVNRIARSCGFGRSELDELTDAGLLLWPGGVPFVADWWVNNTKDKTNYRPGDHPCELGMLEQLPNRRYALPVLNQSDGRLTPAVNTIEDNGETNPTEPNPSQPNTNESGSEANASEPARTREGPRFHPCPACGVSCVLSDEGPALHGYCERHLDFFIDKRTGEVSQL